MRRRRMMRRRRGKGRDEFIDDLNERVTSTRS
jgi:hypothetical protein